MHAGAGTYPSPAAATPTQENERTMLKPWKVLPAAVLAASLLAACGESDPQPSAADVPAEPRTVRFAQPMDGATVTGPDVQVSLAVTGLEIVEAGVFDDGTGHHHIFINEDVTPMGNVIPAGNPRIVHWGLAQTEGVLEGLEPGQYRLIAVVADGAHISLDPPVHDTITITVVPPSP